jgi:pimeloyl-ACP methyl ester carboxylesterase
MSRSAQHFVFLHGGPGFNSYAEEAILGPLFQSGGHTIRFWNEPSRLRPLGDSFDANGAFERWLASAERCVLSAGHALPLHVITHSVTVHAAVEIARRHRTRITSLVVVAPGADTFATFTNVMRLGFEDLRLVKPEIAATIARCLEETRAVLDDPMREGLLNVLHDDKLFTHYWADPKQMAASVAAQAHPEAQFDVESFFAVLSEFGQRGATLLSSEVRIPTLVLFGGRDRITPFEEQRSALEVALPSARMEVLEGCSHYAHLDRPQYFVDTVAEWADAQSRGLTR